MNVNVKSHLVADLVGDRPADGLRVVDLDGVAVVNPLLHVGHGADGGAGDKVAVAAWGRVAVLLGNPVAPGAVLVLGLLWLLGLLPPLLLVPEDMPLASVVAIALSDVRGGALLVMSLLANLKRSYHGSRKKNVLIWDR